VTSALRTGNEAIRKLHYLCASYHAYTMVSKQSDLNATCFAKRLCHGRAFIAAVVARKCCNCCAKQVIPDKV